MFILQGKLHLSRKFPVDLSDRGEADFLHPIIKKIQFFLILACDWVLFANAIEFQADSYVAMYLCPKEYARTT